jgi:hypothetical protein
MILDEILRFEILFAITAVRQDRIRADGHMR